MLEKTLESPLDCKEIQPAHSEGDQPWVFFGRNDAKAKSPVLWPPHVKSWLTGKDSDAGRDWGQEEKGTTEDEMAGWHHGLDGCDFEWTLGVGDGQGGLMYCSLWDMTERLNWTELGLSTRLLGYPKTMAVCFSKYMTEAATSFMTYLQKSHSLFLQCLNGYFYGLYSGSDLVAKSCPTECLSKICMFKFSSQYDSIWMWNLWEVILFRWHLERAS